MPTEIFTYDYSEELKRFRMGRHGIGFKKHISKSYHNIPMAEFDFKVKYTWNDPSFLPKTTSNCKLWEQVT